MALYSELFVGLVLGRDLEAGVANMVVILEINAVDFGGEVELYLRTVIVEENKGKEGAEDSDEDDFEEDFHLCIINKMDLLCFELMHCDIIITMASADRRKISI